MDKKFSFSCFICIFIFGLSISFYFNGQTIIKSENRTVATFPKFPDKISTSKIHHFFTQLTHFYEDNFPHKEKIILVVYTIFPSLKTYNNTNLVLRGKGDWLFLGNSYDNTIDKLTGKFYYHNTSNKKFNVTERYNYYAGIVNKLSTDNNKIFFLIGPNKTSVYPEFLPKTVTPTPKPFHEQLTQKMRQEGINVYYPLHDLIQAKENALLYFVTDTHWNQYGSFIAFIHLISQFDPAYNDIIKEEDFSFKTIDSVAGDLIRIGNFIFNNNKYNDNFEVFYKNTPIQQPQSIFTSRKLTPPILKNTNPDALINKTLLVVGDSFTKALSPYFSLTFKNWYFIHRFDLDKISTEQLKAIHADYILYECVERAF